MPHFSAYPTILAEPYASYPEDDHKRFSASGWICFCDDGEVKKEKDSTWDYVTWSEEARHFIGNR